MDGALKLDGRGKFVRESCKINFCTNTKIYINLEALIIDFLSNFSFCTPTK